MKTLLSILKTTSVALLLSQCSASQDTVTANIYHNTTAHYNGYYYAREKIQEIEKTIQENINENYHQIPPLYPKLDTTLISAYEASAKEAIKMAYISIKRHPHSKWIYPNYIMVGLARLYLHDFKNAIQTFKYVNTKSTVASIRHTALLYLIRALIANQEYKNAEEVIHYLEKQSLDKQNEKQLQLKRAYYYQTIKDYASMAKNLLAVDKSLTKKDGKGKIFFITAQVCHKIGRYVEAYSYYKKCIALNPVYKIDLYAQLGLLQNTPLKNKRSATKIGKQFNKLLTDKKNLNFKDKIYYEMAEFEKKQGHLKKALTYYENATKAKGSDLTKAHAFLRLGQIHFDSLEAYAVAQPHYNRAISLLPKDIEHYKSIRDRQKALDDLVKYMNIIIWQDSLLNMATMDTAKLRMRLTASVQNQEEQKAQEEQPEQYIADNNPSQLSSGSIPGWYFANSTLVSMGKPAFEQTWGSVPLEDNWRRSNKVSVILTEANESDITDTRSAITTMPTEKEKGDEVENIIRQLPKTLNEQKEAMDKIEDAYFEIGSVFQHRLFKKEDAIQSYNTILDRFPTSERIPEALYKLYRISASQTHSKENIYYQKLVSTYPHSNFARIVLDSTYRTKQQIITKTQKEMYQAAYNYFENGYTRSAQQKIRGAMELGVTHFTPHLELLGIMIIGRTESADEYTRRIKMFLEKYPKNALNAYAKKLLIAEAKLAKMGEGNRIHYIRAPNKPHCFAFTYRHEDTIPHRLSSALNKIIGEYPQSNRPEVSKIVLNEKYMINFVCEFHSADVALQFFNQLNAQINLLNTFPTHPAYMFIITKNNLITLRKTKALEEYMAFFDRNYKALTNTMIK